MQEIHGTPVDGALHTSQPALVLSSSGDGPGLSTAAEAAHKPGNCSATTTPLCPVIAVSSVAAQTVHKLAVHLAVFTGKHSGCVGKEMLPSLVVCWIINERTFRKKQVWCA